jgi:arylsulfatase A-like enzyme
MASATQWLRQSAAAHDRWLLFVDEFDPHEPFDTPEPWASMYDETPLTPEESDVGRLIWPPYVVGGVSRGAITHRQARQIRNNYGAKLSMIDHHLGLLLDELDAQDLWDSTAVIVCTDHGHYLGDERGGADIWGKPAVPQYEPLGHTPLMIHWPDHATNPAGVQTPGVIEALTTNVDLHATISDIFGVESAHRTHGQSLVPLLTGASTTIREWAIGGVWGNWVQVTDGRRKYARAPVDDNVPLSMWSNRWSTMPVHAGLEGYMRFPPPDARARLDVMPGSDIPVIRQPFERGDVVPFWASGARNVGRHHLYDVDVDPDERENRTGEPAERDMVDLLRSALTAIDAPDDQFARLGVA